MRSQLPGGVFAGLLGLRHDQYELNLREREEIQRNGRDVILDQRRRATSSKLTIFYFAIVRLEISVLCGLRIPPSINSRLAPRSYTGREYSTAQVKFTT